jgi:AAA15 family ATPase/GTPase
MIASSYDKNYLENENVFIIDNYNHRLVKSVAMYGANASGKTKFLDALAFMRWFVINSSTKTQEGDEIEVDPFRLNSTSIKDTTEFEIIFIANNSQYRYGYELNNKKIISEWLFQKKINSKPKEVELFYRDKKKIDFHKSFAKINTLNEQGEIIRDNALILSVSNQFKVK